MMKNDDWNKKFFTDNIWYTNVNEKNLMQAFIRRPVRGEGWEKDGKIELKVKFNDGTLKDGNEIGVDWGNTNFSHSVEGYDLYAIEILIYNYSKRTFEVKNIEEIFLDIYSPNSDIANRMSFRLEGVHHVERNDTAYCDTIGVLDTIEKISYRYEDSKIDASHRNIELYLKKDLVDPLD
uniref:hypothetical protein n=1 Tax=Bacteroides acidifaciens TaxID=85831 RepID=UPI0025A604C7